LSAFQPIFMQKSSKQAAIGFIFITILLDVMGWGLIIPVMPDLIAELKQIPINEASPFGGHLLSVYAVTQFLFAPFIGNLSDRFGRRPVLLLSLLGFGIDYIILALAPTYGWLFMGRVLAGITGASVTTASAYIADVSNAENRAKNFGLLGAAFGLGFIIGPALGGLIAGFGLRAPFYAAAALCLLNCLYGYFVLPESLTKANRKPFSWKKANPIGSLMLLKKYPVIGGLAVAYFLLFFAAQAVQGNWSFYTMFRFNWTEQQVGISLAVVGLFVGLVQAGLIRFTNPLLGNKRSVYIGLVLYSIGLLLFSLATKGWMMYAFLLPYCLGGIAGPALQSIVAGQVMPNEQGELQGAFTSLMSLTAVFGPLVMNGLFYEFSKPEAGFYFPGIPFFLGAILMLGSAIISWYVLRKVPEEKPVTTGVSKETIVPPSH
jgi:DHA1 family tetracycline resistance protein-like MFS transporter